MKLIKAFSINTNPMQSGVVTRNYSVTGDSGSFFTMTVQNDDGDFYNFPENTTISPEENIYAPAAAFSSTPTSLLIKEIPVNGVYNGSITFPLVTADDYYIINLIAVENTEIDIFSSNAKIYTSSKIYKYKKTTLTISLLHSSSAVVEPSNYTSINESYNANENEVSNKISIDWDITLSSSTCTALRQPTIDDFEFTTTKDTLTAGSSSKILELKDIKGLSVGMGLAATGIATGATITKIIPGYKNNNKSSPSKPFYERPVVINEAQNGITISNGGTVIISADSTFVVDRTITFTGKGSIMADAFNKTKFNIKNFVLKLDDIVTTTTSATSNTVIAVTSADGIKAQQQYTVDGTTAALKTVVVDEVITNLAIGQRLQAISTGTLVGIPTVVAVNTATKTITLSSKQTLTDGSTLTFSNNIVKGIGLKNATTDPYVVSISSNNITVNANQAIESGATTTFIGSSRAANVKADLEITRHGTDDLTLKLNLDNILKVG